MDSKHSSTSEILGEIPEAHSCSRFRLARLLFRTLNQSGTGLCEILNKILSSLWSFKLFAIYSQTRPPCRLPLFWKYSSNSNILFNRIRLRSLLQPIAAAVIRKRDKEIWQKVTLKKNSHLGISQPGVLKNKFLSHTWF